MSFSSCVGRGSIFTDWFGCKLDKSFLLILSCYSYRVLGLSKYTTILGFTSIKVEMTL